MFRSETRIIEDRFGDRVTVLAPSTGEELPISAESCAEQHLLAELKGRYATGRPMPHRVEVRVWQDGVAGEPDALAIWDVDGGISRS
jgi:hypothetical protein